MALARTQFVSLISALAKRARIANAAFEKSALVERGRPHPNGWGECDACQDSYCENEDSASLVAGVEGEELLPERRV